MIPSRLAAISLLLLAGCAHEAGRRDFQGKYDDHFGDAVRHNIEAQTVNPKAPSSDTLETSAQRASQAQTRYEQDKVPEPETMSTTRGVTSSGGGGGGK